MVQRVTLKLRPEPGLKRRQIAGQGTFAHADDGNVRDSVKLAAIRDALDRGGIKPLQSTALRPDSTQGREFRVRAALTAIWTVVMEVACDYGVSQSFSRLVAFATRP